MSFSIRFDKWADFIKTTSAFVVDASKMNVLDTIAVQAITRIRKRTTSGLGVDGVAFRKGYSERPCYIPLRHRPSPKGGQKTPRTASAAKAIATKTGSFSFSAKTGRISRRGGRSMYFEGGYKQFKAGVDSGGAVTLQATGEMFNALQFRRAGKERILYFATHSANAKASGNNERREFFGLNETDSRVLRDAWKEALGGK